MRTILSILTATLLAIDTLVPCAQAAEPAAFEAPLEEVLVTSRKREESLQRVPDSITAFSAQQIEERRINRIGDALAFTPGVHMVKDQDTAMNIITVRGIGTNRNLAASVAFAVDGVLLPDSDAFTADLTDVERIEVLKGPQGALYGRNAIGGVINVTTKKPTNELEGEARLGVARGHTAEAFAALSGPLVKDKLFGRVTVKHRDSDGLIENRFDGQTLDHDRTTKVGGRLVLQATDALSFDLRASYFDQDGGASWYTTSDVLGTTGGRLTRQLGRLNPDLDQDPMYTEFKVTDMALTAEYETSRGTITAISAYDDVDVLLLEDLDLTSFPVTKDVQQERLTRGISQELRFTSPAGERLRFIGGAYYQNTKREVATSGSLDFCFFLALPFCPTPPGVVSGLLVHQDLNTTAGDFDQWAVFSQINYDINDALELTAALRYDQDKRAQRDLLTGRQDQAKFDDLQPKLSLAWKMTADRMLYATYAQGYKSGAFNPPPQPGAGFQLIVQQEGTDSYEVGFKSSWFERRLVANAAAYFTKYEHPQIFRLEVTTGGQVAINAEKAEIKGGEIEIAARLMHGLDLTLGYGYTDAKFTDFDGTGVFDDHRLPNAPRYTLQAGVRHEHAVSATASIVSRLDYHKTGTIFFGEDNLMYQPSYQTVDAQVAFQAERWSVAVWGRNIFDEPYALSAFSRSISPLIYGSLGVDAYTIDAGATYGIEGRWKF